MTRILLTLGEPAGIGPDCILRAFDAQPALFKHTIIVSPPAWITTRAVEIGMNIPIHIMDSLTDSKLEHGLCCWNPVSDGLPATQKGIPSKETAPTVIACIEAAAKSCLQTQHSALVTGPIEKAVLRDAGFNFPGHTEFLAHLAGVPQVVMMLASETLRVALLTTHLALRDVPDTLNIADTLEVLRIIAKDLKKRFGITHPQLKLCALNPHAGEQGHFGDEEIEILTPAVTQAQQEGIQVTGPLPADTLFSEDSRKQCDAIICCYHDQALIPIKALSFGEAVNITLGLPFVRTSVDHGTALTLAGSPQVSCASLISAINMAQAMTQ